MKNEFIPDMQKFVVRQSVGASAMRGQGTNVLLNVHQFLDVLSLGTLKARSRDEYLVWLDQYTNDLLKSAKTWGAARKALNLFMRSALYNCYLKRKYGLGRFERWMEIPLDGIVVTKLRRLFFNQLPVWRGVKYLKRKDSDSFQRAASCLAIDNQITTVHQDIFLWVRD